MFSKGHTNIDTPVHAAPNSTVTIEGIVDSLSSKLQIRIMDVIGVCNEDCIYNSTYWEPYEYIALV